MGLPPSRDETVTSHEILNDHGLAVPNWPVEWGGLARRVRRKGLDRTQHQIWLDEMQLASVRMPARSDPVPGSVMAIAVMSSPDAMPGMDARRSFHGLQVELGNVSEERIRLLVEKAWRQKAPKRLVAGRDRGR